MAFPVYIPFFGLKLHPDAHVFEVRSIKKTCIHIVHPDGRLIPFDTDNLYYRELKQARLAPLRAYSRPSNLTAIRNPA